MSFYSSLILAANDGVATVAKSEVIKLLANLGLTVPGVDDDFNNLAEDVCNLFSDESARAENERFFCPDSISFEDKIAIYSLQDDGYDGPGVCVEIHGYGYFYPWINSKIHRVVQAQKLSQLREALSQCFGGRFVIPSAQHDYLQSRLIGDNKNWTWFISET